jgi:hypothetical protein
MRRALAALAVVGLFAACGFPGVEYESPDAGDAASHPDSPVSGEGSSGDDASGDGTTGDGADAGDDGEASSDSSSGGDTGTDAVGGDTGAVDSPVDVVEEQPLDSGGDAHDAGTDAPPVCDVDMDTYKAEGGVCAGNDCCDTDNQAHPGQTSYFTAPDKCGSFDYNCSGSNEPQYPGNLKCGGTGATGCTGGSAFIGAAPSCGMTGLYGTCVPNGLLACQQGNEVPLAQGCH